MKKIVNDAKLRILLKYPDTSNLLSPNYGQLIPVKSNDASLQYRYSNIRQYLQICFKSVDKALYYSKYKLDHNRVTGFRFNEITRRYNKFFTATWDKADLKWVSFYGKDKHFLTDQYRDYNLG